MEVDRLVDEPLVGGDEARPSAALRVWVDGWEENRLVPYQDGPGNWTVGRGHVMHADDPRVPITATESDALLDTDLLYFSDGVNRLIDMPRRQYQHDALVAFAMNCGLGALATSTLRKLVNGGYFERAAVWFAPWNKSEDPKTGELVVDQGLVKRRAAEKAMFVSGDYTGRP